jgi:hypothetical protein
MRILAPLPLAVLLACSQPRALPVDPAQSGVDCAHAIVITASSETEGIKAEYQWLKDHHPGAVVLGQALSSCGDHAVDRLAIREADGKEGELYFDIGAFFGRR